MVASGQLYSTWSAYDIVRTIGILQIVGESRVVINVQNGRSLGSCCEEDSGMVGFIKGHTMWRDVFI